MKTNPFLPTAIGATAVFFLISLFAATATYRFAAFFLSLLLWTAYIIREPARMHPVHFVFLAIALLLHDLGAFGFYERRFAGLDWDVHVHVFFGFSTALILHRMLRLAHRLRNPWLWATTLLILLGLSAVHELIEWATTLWLGPEKGMLKLRPDDPFDTQEDLFNNLIGGTAAILLQSAIGAARRPDRASDDA